MAPQPLLEEFYSCFLSGDLPALAAHPSANFALQAFLAAANRSPFVKTLLAELKGSFKELLQRRRSGVVAALLAACARTSAGQADASKAIAAALTGLHDEGKVSDCNNNHSSNNNNNNNNKNKNKNINNNNNNNNNNNSSNNNNNDNNNNNNNNNSSNNSNNINRNNNHNNNAFQR